MHEHYSVRIHSGRNLRTMARQMGTVGPSIKDLTLLLSLQTSALSGLNRSGVLAEVDGQSHRLQSYLTKQRSADFSKSLALFTPISCFNSTTLVVFQTRGLAVSGSCNLLFFFSLVFLVYNYIDRECSNFSVPTNTLLTHSQSLLSIYHHSRPLISILN